MFYSFAGLEKGARGAEQQQQSELQWSETKQTEAKQTEAKQTGVTNVAPKYYKKHGKCYKTVVI